MPNNFDRLFNQSQGNELINALHGIKNSLDGNYPLQNVNVTLSSEPQSITPGSGYYGIGMVNVPASGSAPVVGTKTISANGIYNASDDSLDGYNSVTVQVPVPTFNTAVLNVVTNGVYNAAASGYDGYSEVNVQVPGGGGDVGKTVTYSNGTNIPIKMRLDPEDIDGNIYIGNAITDVSYIFGQNKEEASMGSGYCVFNYGVVFNSVSQCTNLSGLLAGCINFDYEVAIPASARDCSYMFTNCKNLSWQINIPDSVTNCAGMFMNTYDFYGYSMPWEFGINIPNNCVNAYGMFSQSKFTGQFYNFISGEEQVVTTTIPASVTNCERLFEGNLYNGIVDVANGCTSLYGLFINTTMFNRPFVIPDSVLNCAAMFTWASAFNSAVTMGNNVTNTAGMFYSCEIFNQPVSMPPTLVNCSNMFFGCREYNQPITLPASVMNCSNMFTNCRNLNQDLNLVIPNSVNNCANMFKWCTNISGNIYINNGTMGYAAIRNMLGNCNNSKIKNVYCNNISMLTTANTMSIVGASITWSEVTNGYYNSVYNIYLYNNYPA